MTTPVPIYSTAIANELDRIAEVAGRVRWIRCRVPMVRGVRDDQSLKALLAMKNVAAQSQHLLKVLEPIDASEITYVFDNDGALMISALYGITQMSGPATWLVSTGVTG